MENQVVKESVDCLSIFTILEIESRKLKDGTVDYEPSDEEIRECFERR